MRKIKSASYVCGLGMAAIVMGCLADPADGGGSSKSDWTETKKKEGDRRPFGFLPSWLPHLYVGATGHGVMPVSKVRLFDEARWVLGDLHTKVLVVTDVGGGGGPIVGLEKLFFNRLYTAVEVDCAWTRYIKPKNYETNPIDPFSWGFSGRLGVKFGNTIFYGLAGLEMNRFRAKAPKDKASYFKTYDIDNNPARFLAAALSINVIDKVKKEHVRVGFGIDHEITSSLRLRGECLWTLPKRYKVRLRQSACYGDGNFPPGAIGNESIERISYINYSKYAIRVVLSYVF